jgi:hypothetical protein
MLPNLGMRGSKALCNKEWFSACIQGNNVMGILEQQINIALIINIVFKRDCNWLYWSVLCLMNIDTTRSVKFLIKGTSRDGEFKIWGLTLFCCILMFCLSAFWLIQHYKWSCILVSSRSLWHVMIWIHNDKQPVWDTCHSLHLHV